MNETEPNRNGIARQSLVDELVEVQFLREDAFLIVKETLTRMGISRMKEKSLQQTCHVLHKKNRYFVVHVKELYALDTLTNKMNDENYWMRDKIIEKLVLWNLIRVVETKKTPHKYTTVHRDPYIIPHKDKREWALHSPYKIGVTQNNAEFLIHS